jgi:hypothetical protein
MSAVVAPKGKALSQSVQLADLENARLGVIFFLSRLEVGSDPEESIGKMKDEAIKLIQSKTRKLDKPLALAGKALDSFEKTVEDISKTIEAWLAERFKVSPARARTVVWQLKSHLPGLIKGIADEVTGGDSVGVEGIAKGLYAAITKAIEYYDLKVAGKDVAMQSGHPELIARAITSAVGIASLKGLGEACLAAAKAALATFTAGVGVIINKIAGVIEVILRFAVRMADALTLTDIFEKARALWQQRNEAGALQLNPGRFTNWFKQIIKEAPIVASLVMNCGVAGDAMRFLQVISHDQVVSDSQFGSGVAYLNKLKSAATDFINDFQDYVSIYSDDKMVASLLKHAGEIGLVQKEASSGWRAQIYTWSNQNSKGSKALKWGLGKIGFKQSTLRT